MKAVITAIIATVILFILLVAMWLPFSTTTDYMDDFANNSTAIKSEHKGIINNFYDTLRNLFTLLFAISLISIPLAYLFDAHRREHEQFDEYERWR